LGLLISKECPKHDFELGYLEEIIVQLPAQIGASIGYNIPISQCIVHALFLSMQ
jgi:hypothetical protein